MLPSTSTTQSHLTCIFSPRVHILTLHAPLHRHCSKSPHIHRMHIFTSHAPLHLHHSKSPCMHILTSHAYCHLVYIISPCMLPSTSTTQSHLMSTSCAYSHLTCSPPPPPLKVTLCTYSHLVCIFSPHIYIPHLACSPPSPPLKVTSHPPRVHILTSHTYSHLTCSPPPPLLKVTSCTYSHLAYIFSPRMLPPPLKVTSYPPHIHILTSHAHSYLACSPPPKIISFTSRGKNSQKNVTQQPPFHQ